MSTTPRKQFPRQHHSPPHIYGISANQFNTSSPNITIMLPSPSRLHNHNFNTTTKHPSATLTSFSPEPSRIILHSCPTFPSYQKPTTALLLSFPLAQEIHNMILTSRCIEVLARRLFRGDVSEEEAARKMSSLEEKYDVLREGVENELEVAWVEAGFLPPTALTPRLSSSAMVKKDNMEGLRGRYMVDKSLKRKGEGSEGKAVGRKARKRRKGGHVGEATEVEIGRDCGEDDEWQYTEPLNPIGVQQVIIPLKGAQKKSMYGWNWREAKRVEERGGMGGLRECVSPMDDRQDADLETEFGQLWFKRRQELTQKLRAEQEAYEAAEVVAKERMLRGPMAGATRRMLSANSSLSLN
ncbi:uncharacterized protein BDR25DRAFT_312973 [Lindgomyces ingoldianus]|uniref:Uncharacterized protein n=1 Tax=Lindgomyces ingoldianus TaxID=673940 RepID=A0ACB6QZM1_9PLEO|nr:uncharacterized protein BDR25DRAFT_312973 [Lindgomyces ingoldianus]KAF2472438.1 hypothetical protein BDR25DRAFT_312973 [Lindgomyces ingoldianus]